MKRILFVTWDGPQASYLENLFVPIFAGLQRHGYAFFVLQFTWGSSASSDRAREACARQGIAYRRANVWRAGSSRALITAILGARQVDRAIREWNIEVLMPRSLLAGLAALLSRSARGCPIVFDSDGLFADERVDFGGLKPNGATYWLLRRIEAALVRRARIVLVRTSFAIPILAERAGPRTGPGKFHVVTNGRIVGPFPDAAGEEATRAGPRLCYLGSIGPQYQPGSMLALAKRIKRDYPATAFSVFTQDAAALEPYLQEELELDWITVESIDPADVPRILSRQDIGLALRTRTLSMQAVAPIKIGDYLLAGLPIIGNAEVGPVGGAVEQACLMPADAPPEAIRSWIADVLANRACWRKRCRKLGVERFSLERSIDDYLAALGGLEEMNGVAEDPGSSDLPRPATGSVR